MILSPLGALSHHPETGQTQRLPARTTLRGQRPPAVCGPARGRKDLGATALRAPTGLWFPPGTTKFTESRPREAPCRLWRGRHSNRESRRPGRLQQRLQGEGQLQPPSPDPQEAAWKRCSWDETGETQAHQGSEGHRKPRLPATSPQGSGCQTLRGGHRDPPSQGHNGVLEEFRALAPTASRQTQTLTHVRLIRRGHQWAKDRRAVWAAGRRLSRSDRRC